MALYEAEAADICDQISANVQALKVARADQADEILSSLVNLAHNLKGIARAVGKREVAELSLALEESVTDARDGSRNLWQYR